MKDLSEVFQLNSGRLEWGLNLRPSGRKEPSLPLSHHAPYMWEALPWKPGVRGCAAYLLLPVLFHGGHHLLCSVSSFCLYNFRPLCCESRDGLPWEVHSLPQVLPSLFNQLLKTVFLTWLCWKCLCVGILKGHCMNFDWLINKYLRTEEYQQRLA